MIRAARALKLNGIDERIIPLHNTTLLYLHSNRSTGNERRQLLQSILRAEDENEEDEDEAPDDEVSE